MSVSSSYNRQNTGIFVISAILLRKQISCIRASIIHKCFVSCNPEILLRAFKVYARPLLEYATCVWSPHYKDKIEAVQRKFTKRLKGCKDMEYRERLS